MVQKIHFLCYFQQFPPPWMLLHVNISAYWHPSHAWKPPCSCPPWGILVHSCHRALLPLSTCRSRWSPDQSVGVCHTGLFLSCERVSLCWTVSPWDRSLRTFVVLCRVGATGQFKSAHIHCALWCHLRTSCYGEEYMYLLFKATFIWVCAFW